MAEGDKRRHGYSRDQRPDCVQVVIALVVTPDGLPLAYEVLPGNTADSKTLRMFLARIEQQYGRARRIWLMDRGIPTEAVLAEMRGTTRRCNIWSARRRGACRGLRRSSSRSLAGGPRGGRGQALAEDGELYVFAESVDRVAKERAMRRRQLKWLWKRLRELAAMEVPREEMLMKLGAARARAPTAWRLVDHRDSDLRRRSMFTYHLDRKKLRRARRREGRYLLRTNLTEDDPAQLWQYYLQLVAVEEAFKNLKGDFAIRPIFHQEERGSKPNLHRLPGLLPADHAARRLHALAPGLTPRSALEKFAAVQMIDVHLPTTDGRELLLTRYTEPEPELRLLLQKLKLELPPQPPPRIATANVPSHPL